MTLREYPRHLPRLLTGYVRVISPKELGRFWVLLVRMEMHEFSVRADRSRRWLCCLLIAMINYEFGDPLEGTNFDATAW
jgi:hypothetical protein